MISIASIRSVLSRSLVWREWGNPPRADGQGVRQAPRNPVGPVRAPGTWAARMGPWGMAVLLGLQSGASAAAEPILPVDTPAAVSTPTTDATAPDATAPDAQDDSVLWQKIRTAMFQDRPINTIHAGRYFDFEVPGRAEDASVVPIAIHSRIPQSEVRYIRKMYVIVDRNPSPVGVRLTFTPEAGKASVETRIRVEQYSPIRVVAELDDGTLYMKSRFIKASGGCSAPAGKDPLEARAGMGQIRLRVDGQPQAGQPVLAQLMIRHPNDSGMVMDQVSRTYAPAHFVREIVVHYADQVVMKADIDFTISENPNFRFWFRPEKSGALRVDAEDNTDLKFEHSLQIRVEPQPS